jgi:peroxiredoxin
MVFQTMISDGNMDFYAQLGLLKDLRDKGLGVRGERFAMVVDYGVISYLGVGDNLKNASGVEAVLNYLKQDKRESEQS